MTHTTEQERAEFEKAWRERPIYMGGVHQKEVAYIWWTQAARRAPAVPVPQSIEQMAVDRYKVVPSHSSMFYPCAVVAGDGQQQLYIGREVECQNMARKFTGAFLDGAFVALAAAPQPPEAARVPSIAVTPEMVEAANEAYCPFGDMQLAIQAALAAAPQPPEVDMATPISVAAPVQLPENLREGEPYDNPAFEALARALGVWGTAQSAVCAQFWIAAKEQST